MTKSQEEVESLNVRLVNWGHEQCHSAHSYGPGVRDHYLIHYVEAGSGCFTCAGVTYSLVAGQGFLIIPGSVVAYQADTETPWAYRWVGYAGPDARALTYDAGLEGICVFSAEPKSELCAILSQIEQDVSAFASPARGEMCAMGGLLRFLAKVGTGFIESEENAQPAREQVYEKACWYLRAHFDRTVSIRETAAFVGLSRSQLFRIFKACGDCSPVERLTQLRLERVRELLLNTPLSIKEIALSSGFSSTAHLCALFREKIGVTPGQYRADGERF